MQSGRLPCCIALSPHRPIVDPCERLRVKSGFVRSGEGGCSSYAASEADHTGHASREVAGRRACARLRWLARQCLLVGLRFDAAMEHAFYALSCGEVDIGAQSCSRRLCSVEVLASANSPMARLLPNAVKQKNGVRSQLLRTSQKLHGLIRRLACLQSKSLATRRAR